jgi:hypothetical protein
VKGARLAEAEEEGELRHADAPLLQVTQDEPAAHLVQHLAEGGALLETREALYPELSGLLSLGREADTRESVLSWVLDGIAARIERRARKGRPAVK